MKQDLFFTILISHDEGLPGLFIHHRFASALNSEARAGNLFPVDETQCQPVGQGGPKRFHEVQGQTGAARAIGVEEAHIGVEAHGLQGRTQVKNQQGVEKRKHGIDPVPGRPTAAAREDEIPLLLEDEVIENGKIAPCGLALDPPKHIH